MSDRKLAAEHVRAWLDYRPESGEFIWLASPRANVKEGDIAGYESGEDDRHGPRIRLGGVLYPARHLAILHVTGRWPAGVVLPKNRVHSDVRYSNLVVTSRSQSRLRTQASNKNNVSGMLGVTAARGRWQARFKGVYLGVFDSAEDASAAYWAARNEAQVKCSGTGRAPHPAGTARILAFLDEAAQKARQSLKKRLRPGE